MTLSQQSCEACRKGAPQLTGEALAAELKQLPDWQLITRDGVEQITRLFPFSTFKDALAFTQRVGDMAEGEDHHPVITTEWGKVTVVWWTHEIDGLHKNDLICAAKTDALFD